MHKLLQPCETNATATLVLARGVIVVRPCEPHKQTAIKQPCCLKHYPTCDDVRHPPCQSDLNPAARQLQVGGQVLALQQQPNRYRSGAKYQFGH